MKMMKTVTGVVLSSGLFLASAGAIAAEGLSYSFAELDYRNFDVDQEGEGIIRDDFDNGGGWGIDASWALTDMFFVYGKYSDTESDFTFVDNTDAVLPGEVDMLRFDLGVGAVLPMSTMTDIVVSGGYADLDFEDFTFGGTGTDDFNAGDLDDDASDGYVLDAALRSQLTDQIEGSLGARYTDLGGFDGFSVIGNVMYEFTPNWGVNLSMDAGDEITTWGLGVRYSY